MSMTRPPESRYAAKSAKVSFTGLARIKRLDPAFWLRIPIINLNLAHDLGHPCAIYVLIAVLTFFSLSISFLLPLYVFSMTVARAIMHLRRPQSDSAQLPLAVAACGRGGRGKPTVQRTQHGERHVR